MANSNAASQGGGVLIKSGKPSASTTKRDFSAAPDLIEWGAGPKNAAVLVWMVLMGGFFARVGLAWRLLWTGEVRLRLHPRVALDLSRRFVQSAAYAETGQELDESGEEGSADE
jgi:hypothetical protein